MFLLTEADGFTQQESTDMLHQYVLHADRYKGALKIGGPSQNTCFVRWDAMCILLNKFIIEKDAYNLPLVQMSPVTIVGEGTEAQASDLLLAKIKAPKVPKVNSGGEVTGFFDVIV